MITIEGMDNSGKTTLLNRLAEDLCLTSVKNYQRPRDNNDILQYSHAMQNLNFNMRGKLILDRISSISEPIYGPICRDTKWIDPEVIEECHQRSRQANALVIYCRPPNEKILDFGDRPQMPGVIDRAKQLLVEYDKQMAEVRRVLCTCNYDYTVHSYEAIKSVVYNHLGGPVQ